VANRKTVFSYLILLEEARKHTKRYVSMFFIPSILKDLVTQLIFTGIEFVMKLFLYFILYHSNLKHATVLVPEKLIVLLGCF